MEKVWDGLQGDGNGLGWIKKRLRRVVKDKKEIEKGLDRLQDEKDFGKLQQERKGSIWRRVGK